MALTKDASRKLRLLHMTLISSFREWQVQKSSDFLDLAFAQDPYSEHVGVTRTLLLVSIFVGLKRLSMNAKQQFFPPIRI